MSIRKICAALVLLLAACGGGSGDTQPGSVRGMQPAATADITLLFMGNRHTTVNALPMSLQESLRAIAAETVQTIPPRMWCPGDVI